jgi:fatty-acyl-CoA synthase
MDEQTLAARRQTLGDLLRRTAARVPKKIAIRCGHVEWTYAQFDRLCDEFAAGLASLGVAAGDRVAVLARNSHAWAVVRFALARLGAVLVPVNFMLNAAEVAYILRHSEARLLCVDPEFAALGAQARTDDTRVERIIELPAEDAQPRSADLLRFDELLLDSRPPPIDFDGHRPAQIVYTSGTESLPKGAMHTHDAVISEYVSCLVDAEIAHEDRILHAMPMYHCAQLDVFLGSGVYVGSSHVITAHPTPDNLLALIERHRITSFFAPPTVWISLLRSPKFNRSDLSSLGKGYYGASSMPVEILLEMQRRLPGVRLWNLYGQTEIAPLAMVLKPEDQMRKLGSAGRAVLNVETRVVDEAGDDVAPGETGEIVHRSPQLLSGYYRDEQRSNAAFTGGWFHSGDLATIDLDGYITVVDRKKDMIKSGGENVASREVEEVLYGLPQISEAAVIGLPDARWIEAVTAVVVLRDGQFLSEQDVMAHCAAKLARFKVPKRIVFTDSLPKNPSGKLLKRELRKRFHQ